MKLRLLILLSMSALLQSCMYDDVKTHANKQIDAPLRNTIKAKNDSLLEAFVVSDNKALKQLASENFKKDMHIKIKDVIWPFRNGQLTTNYTVVDEYHCLHGKANNNTKLESSDNGYSFIFRNNEKESYVSLLKCTYGTTDDYMVTIIYGRQGNDWKIDHIGVSFMGLYGKTAKDYFELAQKEEKSGMLFNAFFYIDAAEDMLEPSGKMLVYNEAERIDFYHKKYKDAVNGKYRFPMILDMLPTNPSVISIEPIKNAHGLCPLVNYATQVPVTDTESLQREYERIKKEMKSLVPDLNGKYVYYRAYNLGDNAPDGNEAFYNFEEVNQSRK